jgi:hypothetical protein
MTSGAQTEAPAPTCAAPKLHPAFIFNNFNTLLAARTGDAVRRISSDCVVSAYCCTHASK